MKKSRLVILLFALMMSIASFAQKQSFSGTVVDSNGDAVIGASVVLKGTSVGSITDLDGHFTINVEPGQTLTVSFVGYKTVEVKAAPNMSITLTDDEAMLNDVVVIGYGVQKKSVVTASIAKVSSEDLEGKTRLMP